MVYFLSKKLYFHLKNIILEDLIMKKFSEFKANLTYKKARNYSAIAAIVLTIIPCISIATFLEDSIFLTIFVAITLCICLYSVFLFGIFQAHKLMEKELTDETKQRVLSHYNLTKDQYIKVNYIYDQPLDSQMITKLIDFYDFYVKLNDTEEIDLIVKDKNNNIVFTKTINNFIYFEAHFKN